MVNTPETPVQQSVVKEYLTFRKMITPIIIQVLFWIGTAGFVLFGLVMTVLGATARYGGGATVLLGLLCLTLGPLYVRITCELLILFFKMQESLTDIRSELKSNKGSGPMLA